MENSRKNQDKTGSVSKLRILHCPTTTGGNPVSLARQERLLGESSHSMTLEQNYLNYPVDQVLWEPSDGFLKREWKRLCFVLLRLSRFDIVHYNFGTSIAQPGPFQKDGDSVPVAIVRFLYAMYRWWLQGLEFFLLRRKGIPVFVTYQGDDARQGEYCRQNFRIHFADRVRKDYYTQRSDAFKRLQISRFEQNSHKIYALNPDLLNVLPETAGFLPYSHVHLEEWMPVYSQNHEEPLKFVHAPTNREVKGTEYFLNALEELKEEGYRFELILVEGESYAEAQKLYAGADVLLDQLLAGWYGGLTVELMALGKPAVVYVREEDLHFIPEQMKQDLPHFQAEPDTVKETLRLILEMPREDLVQRARASRIFVENWHHPESVARRLIQDYRDARKKGKL